MVSCSEASTPMAKLANETAPTREQKEHLTCLTKFTRMNSPLAVKAVNDTEDGRGK